jgi:hypothetical protein
LRSRSTPFSVARFIAAPTLATGGAAPPVQMESRQADTVVDTPLLAGD